MTVEEHIPLAPLTTFKIGGAARFFARVRSVDELREALDFARERTLRIFILGGGSNVLVDDAGFDGMVVKIEIEGVESEPAEHGELVIAGAGERWDALALRAARTGLWGVENLSGIPGTLGGAVVQNIGAYGAALCQTLQWVEVFDTQRNGLRRLSREECAFGYRGSVFKHEHGRYVVLRAALQLTKEGEPNLSYKDLEGRFAHKPAVGEIREAILEIRSKKFPDLAREGAAGSYFKNPILGEVQAHALRAKYPGLPLYALPETGGVKVPLAWLMDHVLNLRGFSIAGARLFERQPLVVATKFGTPCRDVYALAEHVRERVKKEFEIDIEPEVQIVR